MTTIETTKSPSDVQALFDKDPLELTRANIDELILVYRNARHLFNSGNVKAGSAKPLTEKAKKQKALVASLSLGDLDL